MLAVTALDAARVFQQKKDSTEADKAQRPAAGWFYVLGRMLRSGVLDQDPYLGAEGIYKGKKKSVRNDYSLTYTK